MGILVKTIIVIGLICAAWALTKLTDKLGFWKSIIFIPLGVWGIVAIVQFFLN